MGTRDSIGQRWPTRRDDATRAWRTGKGPSLPTRQGRFVLGHEPSSSAVERSERGQT